MTPLARDGSVDTHSIAPGGEPLLMKRKVAVRKITVEFNPDFVLASMALWRGSIDLKFPMKDDFKVHMMLNRKSILESYLQASAMWISMLDAMKPVDADAV